MVFEKLENAYSSEFYYGTDDDYNNILENICPTTIRGLYAIVS